jgi:hypothetical protein
MEPMSRATMLKLKSNEDAKYRRLTISHAVTAIYRGAVMMAEQSHDTVFESSIPYQREMIPEIIEEVKKLFPDCVVKKTLRKYLDGKVIETEDENDIMTSYYITIDWT